MTTVKELMAGLFMMAILAALVLFTASCGKKSNDNESGKGNRFIYAKCSAIAYDYVCSEWASEQEMRPQDFHDAACYESYQWCVNSGGQWPAIQKRWVR